MKLTIGLLISLLIGLLSFAGCTTAPETGRSQFAFLPESELDAMAADAFSQMKQELKVSQNAEMNARLRTVGERIVVSARARGADLPPPEQWEFVVFEDEAVNAFAMPGGKVGFYTGIFPLFDSDDDLAVVMGHEVAHVAADHGRERVSHQMSAQIASAALAIGLGLSDVGNTESQIAMAAFGAGAQVGILLPFSRTQESEADHIGLIYSASAGYDPRVSVGFWEKMGSQGGARPPEFLSTHPDYRSRKKRLDALIPEVMPLYRQAKGEYSYLGPVRPDALYDFYLAEASAHP